MPLGTRSPTYALGNRSRGGRAMCWFYSDGVTWRRLYSGHTRGSEATSWAYVVSPQVVWSRGLLVSVMVIGLVLG
ncbi:hypothetical protein DDJ68_22140 [Mycobacteroides abscessus]|nr:hypothetical protein DDJ68_22140 [Mycobacteroides abscessus]RIR99536.1 hypothetical protein D2E57_02550 [Mycobacteroides abscessus]